MMKLEIISKNDFKYDLKDERENNYTFNLEFLDIKEEPKKGDYIYINKELLNPIYDGYTTNYTFGSLDSKYGKENISMADIDIIKIVIDEMEIYLKRLYG